MARNPNAPADPTDGLPLVTPEHVYDEEPPAAIRPDWGRKPAKAVVQVRKTWAGVDLPRVAPRDNPGLEAKAQGTDPALLERLAALEAQMAEQAASTASTAETAAMADRIAELEAQLAAQGAGGEGSPPADPPKPSK